MDVKDNGDGTYSVEYVPERPGRHSVDVKYGGRRVPKSPFRVQVKPSGDASKVEIDGLGPDDTFLVGKENDFTVDCTKAGKGQSCGIKLFKKHFFSLVKRCALHNLVVKGVVFRILGPVVSKADWH